MNFADKRPRHYAEEIGQKARELINAELKHVPQELREMVLDHVINGMAIGRLKAKSKTK
jgi:F0F1-type ATP synthase membrane subunit b/b'